MSLFLVGAGRVPKVLPALRASQLRRKARKLSLPTRATPHLQRQACSGLREAHLNVYSPHKVHSTARALAGEEISAGESASPAAYYIPPQKGLVSRLPTSWIPYAELIRLDKPTGTYYLFFPCLFSTLLAAPIAQPMSSPAEVISTAALFFTGALIMRGAGCTINDLWDRNLDPHVNRTKFRPLARKATTPLKAVIFTGFQLLTGLGILLQFPTQCLFYGIPSLMLVASYPLAKRVTNYPQFVLGLTFSWGAMMGFPALSIDLLSNSDALAAAAALYASCVAWTVNYDMIYAHMDIRDDVHAGIKSIALAHEHNTKAILSSLSVVQIGLLATAGYFSGAGPIFFLGSCGGAAATLATMIYRVRLNEAKDCWWWFKNGCWFTGGSIAAGLFGDYFFQRSSHKSGRPVGVNVS
jgi:4-hydroxybenzoate polyprenyltransferase